MKSGVIVGRGLFGLFNDRSVLSRLANKIVCESFGVRVRVWLVNCYSRTTTPNTNPNFTLTLTIILIIFDYLTYLLRGFAKLKKFQKSKKNVDRAQPTHPPPIQFFFFFGNPSVTRPEHSNRIYRQNISHYAQTT